MRTICESMDARGNRARLSNARVFYAQAYFRKGLLHATSLCTLVEPIKQGREADLAGLCVLARSLIETHNVFVYLTEPGISSHEQKLRLALLHLNQAVDLMRVIDALGVTPKNFGNWAQEMSRDFTLSELSANAIFQSLEQQQREKLLRGGSPYLMARYRGPRPVPRPIEAAAYNLFSHGVHSFGLSSSYQRSETPAGYVNVLFLAIEISLIFLAHLAKRYQSVRSRAVGILTQAERIPIEDALSLRHFNAWKQKLRAGIEW